MEVVSKQSGRDLVVALSGELDHHGAHKAIFEITTAVERAVPKTVTLDFSGVSFMDSSGIAVVIRTRQQMSRLGGSLRLAAVPTQAKKVFEAAGVTRLVSMMEGDAV